MRKYLLLLISLAIVLGAGFFVLKQRGDVEKQINKFVSGEIEQAVAPASVEVSVAVDFGEGIKKEARVRAMNAFHALRRIAQQNNFEIKTKQYDFGIFVESIGGARNTSSQAWIYFVNDKAGEVASDKYQLKEGDAVEWKYTKQTF